MTIKNAMILAAGVLVLALALSLLANRGFIDFTTSDRVMGAVFGLILASFGNVIPKSLRPLSDENCEPAKAQAYRRFAGWAFVLAGVGSAAVWLTFPMELANSVSMAIVASSVVLVVAVCVLAHRGSAQDAAL